MRCATKSFAAAVVIGTLSILASCGGGKSIGQPCAEHGDCADELQCLEQVCTPGCESHVQCGDGFLCENERCEKVFSRLGDDCERELDCGRGQTCLPMASSSEGTEILTGSCARQRPGAAVGSECRADDECSSGSCNLDRCTELCASESDCPGSLTCTLIPRHSGNSSARLRGCFQEGGVLERTVPLVASHALLALGVPGNARSITVTARAQDAELTTGVYRLETPRGTIWYKTPDSSEEFLANPIRYTPAPGESTILFPNRPDLTLTAGTYFLRVGTALSNGEAAQEVPRVRVVYKLGDSAILDINVHLLDLEDHPCWERIGARDLRAATAANHPGFAEFRERLALIFETADIQLGAVRFSDVTLRPDLDALEIDDLGELLPNAEGLPGLNLFLVRSLEPSGLQVIGGGTPAAPRHPNSRTAGVALSMDTLCYRDWSDVARMVAHAFGRQMGLFRNREPGSATQDPIGDSQPTADNLMFFSEFGGAAISPGQAHVLRNYPGLR